jgi:hypothetical protein
MLRQVTADTTFSAIVLNIYFSVRWKKEFDTFKEERELAITRQWPSRNNF